MSVTTKRFFNFLTASPHGGRVRTTPRRREKTNIQTHSISCREHQNSTIVVCSERVASVAASGGQWARRARLPGSHRQTVASAMKMAGSAGTERAAMSTATPAASVLTLPIRMSPFPPPSRSEERTFSAENSSFQLRAAPPATCHRRDIYISEGWKRGVRNHVLPYLKRGSKT